MAGRLMQVLTFANVPAGAQATLPHDIRWNDREVIPDWILPDATNGAFTVISCTATQLTIQNDQAAPASFVFWLVSWHSILRQFNNVATKFLSPLPFIVGGGVNSALAAGPVVTWSQGEAWVDVYGRILASEAATGGPVLVLIEPSTTSYVMTPASTYDLSRVRFVGLTGAFPTIVEMVDGILLGVDVELGAAELHSDGVLWIPDCTTTPLVSGDAVSLEFENSGMIVNNDVRVFTALTNFQATLEGLSRLTGGGSPGTGMIDSANISVICIDFSTIDSGTFVDGSIVGVFIDASSSISPNAAVINPDLVFIVRLDDASRVNYDDDLPIGVPNTGTLEAENVQAAIDALKFMSGPERRNATWSAGLQTGTALNITQTILDVQSVGTVGTVAPVGTNVVTATFRRTMTSAAGANSAAELFGDESVMYRGAFSSIGGFKLFLRWAPAIIRPANMRAFFGLQADAVALAGTTDPAALLNCVGFSWIIGETTMRFQHNDGAGAATRILLGAIPTNDPTVLLNAMIWCERNSGVVNFWIHNTVNNVVQSGAVSTDLPSPTTFLNPHFHANNGGTAAALQWDFAEAQFYFP